MNSKDLGKIIIWIGVIALITTGIDFYAIVFPLNVKNSEWVFSVTQQLSNIAIMPIIALFLLLLGCLLARTRVNKVFLGNLEKATAIVSLLFAIGFLVSSIMYGISTGGVEDKMVKNIKESRKMAQERLDAFYQQNKANIDEERLNQVIENMDSQMMSRISEINFSMQESNFKTILNLLFFSLIHFYVFLKVFNLTTFAKQKLFRSKVKAKARA